MYTTFSIYREKGILLLMVGKKCLVYIFFNPKETSTIYSSTLLPIYKAGIFIATIQVKYFAQECNSRAPSSEVNLLPFSGCKSQVLTA